MISKVINALSQAYVLAILIGFAVFAVFFTPVGGVINLVVSGICLFGGGYLAVTAIGMALDFKNYGYPPHIKEMLLRFGGATIAGAVILAVNFVLPAPPNIGGCSGEVGRSGYIRDCH
ncbi:hypothetical protein HB772_09115 [Sinorhizobium meliloti]|nr:hypothetical protein HB772_09115 [Sinorhizobium meliloti]